MTLPAPVPASSFHPGDFVADVEAEDAVYFLLNVGDGDTQLIVLPEFRGVRRALVVDVATTEKLPGLIEELASTVLFPVGSRFSIVVGTHPHDDHIRGMPEFIDRFGDLIDEYWEPGYYHPTKAFFETMRALEDRGIRQLQPTSGTTRFLGTGKVTVLAPAIGLRNRFDSYGVEINNASLSMMVEAPASRYLERDRERRYVRRPDTNKLLLGADAQTLVLGPGAAGLPATRAGELSRRQAAAGGPRLRSAQGRRVQDPPPRVQARRQPRARGSGQPEDVPDLLRGRRRQVQLPARGLDGGDPRGDAADRVDGRRRAARTICSTSTTRTGSTRTANTWDRSPS